jgi:hypothetical protein
MLAGILLHWWDCSCRLEKVSKYNMLMEVSVAFAVLMIIYGWDVKNTWLISLIWISGWYPDFKDKKAWGAL